MGTGSEFLRVPICPMSTQGNQSSPSNVFLQLFDGLCLNSSLSELLSRNLLLAPAYNSSGNTLTSLVFLTLSGRSSKYLFDQRLLETDQSDHFRGAKNRCEGITVCIILNQLFSLISSKKYVPL